MKRFYLRDHCVFSCRFLVVLACACGLAGANADSTVDGFDKALVEAQVPGLMEQHRVPGVAIAIVENNQIAWTKTWGLKRAGHGDPIDSQTLFEAASMSKPLFAYAVLLLVEQGELDLDRPLVEYLDQPYMDDQPDHKRITARMVLNHTSGFPNWRENGARKGGPLPVKFSPGSKFGYSGEGFLYLQRVVEHITGESLAKFMKRILLTGIGMERSSYIFDENQKSNYAGGHDHEGKFKSGRRYYRDGNAAYTLYTTPADYSRFLIEMMASDRSAAHSIAQKSVDEMIAPAIRASAGAEQLWRGLGWVIQQTDAGKRVSHSGSNGSGFRCHSRFYADRGAGIVIMTNSSSGVKLWKALVDVVDRSTVVASQASAAAASAPVFPGDDWQVAPGDLLAARWDTEKLAALKERWQEVQDQQLSSALLVIDSGCVVFEGGESRRPIPCHSVRKSFLNGLYGVLERKGKLDLDATLASLGMTDRGQLSEQESKVTLLQVLQARSGVYLPAEYETEKMKELRPARHSHPPGSFYYYNNWDFNVAGAIFAKLDGRGIGKAFQEEFADPLGMQDFAYTTDVTLHHDSPPQSEYPAYPFLMSARDRARFGLLFLRRGKWAQQQILNEGWIDSSVQAHSSHEADGYHPTERPDGSKTLSSGRGYGLLWWVSPGGYLYGQKLGVEPAAPFSARGYFGQVIAVVPSRQMVVVLANDRRVAGQKPTPGSVRKQLFELIFAARQ